MQILFFCPRWGMEQLSWEDFFQQVKNAGYDGVEISLPLEKNEKNKILDELEKYELKLIGQHWETVVWDFKEHNREYELRLQSLSEAEPLFINSQTGKDYYTFEQNQKLIELATSIAEKQNIPIVHETHRGKFSFAAHITQFFLQQIPDLKLTLDISHWCNTAESFLQDQTSAVDLAISRTEHIHSRIGYPEGPQVNDPRASEWKEALEFHLQCWDKVVSLQEKTGRDFFTITTEFGPAPYMPLHPYTKEPVSDQWEINLYMMELLKKRYDKSVL